MVNFIPLFCNFRKSFFKLPLSIPKLDIKFKFEKTLLVSIFKLLILERSTSGRILLNGEFPPPILFFNTSFIFEFPPNILLIGEFELPPIPPIIDLISLFCIDDNLDRSTPPLPLVNLDRSTPPLVNLDRSTRPPPLDNLDISTPPIMDLTSPTFLKLLNFN